MFWGRALQTGAQMRSIEVVSETALSDEILNWCEHADQRQDHFYKSQIQLVADQ